MGECCRADAHRRFVGVLLVSCGSRDDGNSDGLSMETMMRRALLPLLLSLLAADALAISRYDSTRMSCAQVRGTIQSEGAAIMRWRSARVANLPLYGRYVRDGSYCGYAEYADTVYIPTADRRSCPVYECKQIEPDDSGRRLRRP